MQGQDQGQGLVGLSSVLRPRQHNIGYMGRRFLQVIRLNQQYQSTEGTNSYSLIHSLVDHRR